VRRLRGGNARKQKRQLSDTTLRSVIGAAEGPAEALLPDDLALESAEGDALFADDDEEDLVTEGRQAMYEQGLAPINGFVFSRYVLGTATCSACRYEMIYYQDRAVLHQGFTLRCRVCQTMQTITLHEE
jgi:hypothetical protein